MSQNFFDFCFETRTLDGNFIVSESNDRAFNLIQEWPNWKTRIIHIYGPANSGKTMLANIWASKSQAVNLVPQNVYRMASVSANYDGCYIVESIENIHDEASLLHFFNSVQENGGYMLLTSRNSPSNLKIRLADLRSRINSVTSCGVDNPDDELLRTLFFKHFIERQLKVEMNVIDYLVSCTERSFAAVEKIVRIIDLHALQEKRNITIPFIKTLL